MTGLEAGLRKLLALVFAALLLLIGSAVYSSDSFAQSKETVERTRYREAARTHFEKRCKENAGERIYRTVDDVEGFLLSDPQRRLSEADIRNQYWKGNLYGFSLYPPAELSEYLLDLDENNIATTRSTTRSGFAFVEVPDGGGTFKRYRRDLSVKEEISFLLSDSSRSRYIVSREDISTESDRTFWVAGGRLKVVDVKSGELLGERVGYVFEAGFGSTSAGRRPWLFAQRNACPPIPMNAAIDRVFVEKVLKPKREMPNAR